MASRAAGGAGQTRETNPASASRITFAKDIAPILFSRCSACHQPGGAGPFSVLTYADARQHATQIAAATRRRYMPPWKAEPGYGEFAGLEPLSDAQIALIQGWVDGGALAGDEKDLPPQPPVRDGWQLGKPDLIVTLPQAYTLPPAGTDVFRIFAIPLPNGVARYVRGMEVHPGSRVVHHANIRIDRTGSARRLDEDDPAPGYDGLMPFAAVYPDGHFLGWTPGQVPPLLPKGLAWRLDPGTDLVVQLHMQPTGKPEVVAPSIGFFFGNDPPERTPAMVRLGRQNIDIPAGERAHAVTDSYVLPVDVEVQALQPHAHYRAREVTGTAMLPDGTTKWLISIKDWDFRWQHVYRLVHPMALPKGTRLEMRWLYDNSIENPRNPQRPAGRVVWGQRSADEMGDLWIQVLPRNDRDLETLNNSLRPKVLEEDLVGYEMLLRGEPGSVALHDDAALLYLALGRPDRAVAHFGASAALKPDSAPAHFNLAVALSVNARLDEAVAEYRLALQIRPDYAAAHNNLGSVLLEQGLQAQALSHLREAIRIDPAHEEARYNLGRAYRAQGDTAAAIESFRQALRLEADVVPVMADLAWLLATAPVDGVRDGEEAVRLAERAVDLTGKRDPGALDVLAAAYAETGQFDRAAETARAALLVASPQSIAAEAIRLRAELYAQQKPYRAAKP
jgi:tetratricopeptide (TPR) repeat protein/mono/diheme cytochrome c family protein